MAENLSRTAEKNETFFKSGPARKSWTEIVELVNDAIDHVGWFVKLTDWRSSLATSPVANYLAVLLMPLSYGVYTDLLVGNLPCCFMQLRVLIEQLGKTRYSERGSSQKEPFQEKLTDLETKIAQRKISLTQVIRGSLGHETAELWAGLSERWIHVKGLRRIIEAVEADSSRLNLVMPMPLTEADLPDLVELQKGVATFRRVLAQTVGEWKKGLEH
jgi:hypothetical protein